MEILEIFRFWDEDDYEYEISQYWVLPTRKAA